MHICASYLLYSSFKKRQVAAAHPFCLYPARNIVVGHNSTAENNNSVLDRSAIFLCFSGNVREKWEISVIGSFIGKGGGV